MAVVGLVVIGGAEGFQRSFSHRYAKRRTVCDDESPLGCAGDAAPRQPGGRVAARARTLIPERAASIGMIERGTIEQINARGRVTVRLADRRVFADIHNGSGGCVGDLVEGEMRAGMHSWRNVGNSILSVVHVVAIEPIADAPGATEPDPATIRQSTDRRHSDAISLSLPADQSNNRRLT